MLKNDELNVKPEDWVHLKVSQFEDDAARTLRLPLKDDGSLFTIEDLYEDQTNIVCEIMKSIKDWLECKDLSKFKPLRMIVNGSGGSGKSVVINTLVTVLRQMFGSNDVVKVVAPTGTAAFNVGGETFHHLTGMGISSVKQYVSNSCTGERRLKLIQKFKTMLALIVDERSLAGTKDFGTTATMISETIFQGGPLSHASFGGLPIVVLFGDDYQLPSQEESPLEALFKKGGGKMNQVGRRELLDCSKHVMQLKGNKRMADDKADDKILVDHLRKNQQISDQEVHKLLSLHLDVIERKHGKQVVEKITNSAIFLFYRNAPRARKNIECVKAEADEEVNPVAVIKPCCKSNISGKSFNKHFDGDPPEASILCRGAKVALEGRNFCPMWGLHNGACGSLEEIVFASGHNPNDGDLPMYAVVNFPQYCGPIWDENSPKVRKEHPIPESLQIRTF